MKRNDFKHFVLSLIRIIIFVYSKALRLAAHYLIPEIVKASLENQ